MAQDATQIVVELCAVHAGSTLSVCLSSTPRIPVSSCKRSGAVSDSTRPSPSLGRKISRVSDVLASAFRSHRLVLGALAVRLFFTYGHGSLLMHHVYEGRSVHLYDRCVSAFNAWHIHRPTQQPPISVRIARMFLNFVL